MFSMRRSEFDRVLGEHIHRQILTGELTVNKPGNPRDLGAYLQSAKFMHFQNSLRFELGRSELRRKEILE